MCVFDVTNKGSYVNRPYHRLKKTAATATPSLHSYSIFIHVSMSDLKKKSHSIVEWVLTSSSQNDKAHVRASRTHVKIVNYLCATQNSTLFSWHAKIYSAKKIKFSTNQRVDRKREVANSSKINSIQFCSFATNYSNQIDFALIVL